MLFRSIARPAPSAAVSRAERQGGDAGLFHIEAIPAGRAIQTVRTQRVAARGGEIDEGRVVGNILERGKSTGTVQFKENAQG